MTSRRGSPGGSPYRSQATEMSHGGRSSAEPPPKDVKTRLAGGSPYPPQATEMSHGTKLPLSSLEMPPQLAPLIVKTLLFYVIYFAPQRMLHLFNSR